MNSVPSERVKGNLLVVDDDLSALRTMETLLGREGYDVRCAPSGQMALTFAHEDPPELILLDIRLPDMDGFQVCRSLRGNQKTHAIPVIFISALDERADKLKGFGAGGVDYVTKPFQSEEVLARVEAHLTLTLNIPLPTSTETLSASTLQDVERSHVLAVLEKTGWRVGGKGGAAEALGVNRSTLQWKMKKLGLKRPTL